MAARTWTAKGQWHGWQSKKPLKTHKKDVKGGSQTALEGHLKKLGGACGKKSSKVITLAPGEHHSHPQDARGPTPRDGNPGAEATAPAVLQDGSGNRFWTAETLLQCVQAEQHQPHFSYHMLHVTP